MKTLAALIMLAMLTSPFWLWWPVFLRVNENGGLAGFALFYTPFGWLAFVPVAVVYVGLFVLCVRIWDNE